jgi:type IV pilus assembly protein PilW|tara:strand:+ start:76243 stop:77313 length:1071 start_codon:yes stop_codon:yes gene_type:complete
MRAELGYSASRNKGLSLVEILISLSLGAFMLIGIISLIASVSSTRQALTKTSEQIENGRYALQLFAEDIAMAGFYGKYHPGVGVAEPTLPDPCANGSVLADLGFNNSVTDPEIPVAVAGYASGATLPSCISDESAVVGSEVLVVHRVAPSPIDLSTSTLPPGNSIPYFQASDCGTGATAFVFDKDPDNFTLQKKDCSTTAEVWPYQVRSYFIAPCEDCSGGGNGDGKPSLKVHEYLGGSVTTQALVSGVEDMHFSYGIDLNSDGGPDCYVDDPSADTAPAGCTTAGWSAVDAENWEDVVAVRVYLLVRGSEAAGSINNGKTFDMGRAGRVGPFTDGFKRQVYSSVITIPNVAGVRE